jgi:carbonic anhydrase
MKTALSLLVALLAAGCVADKPAASRDRGAAALEAMSTHDALRELRMGNERFAEGDASHRDLPDEVRAVAIDAHPFAAVLTSIDARVTPAVVFDQGIGDLIAVRIGGMIVSDDVLGSLEYACRIRGAKLIVVLGHSDAEAIVVASDPPDYELGFMTPMIEQLTPIVAAVPEHVTPRDASNPRFITEANRLHVWRTMADIRERSRILREMITNGSITLVGAMYDVETGKVEWFE